MPVSSNHKKRIVAFASAFVLAAAVAVALGGWLMDRLEGQIDVSLTVQGAKGGYVQVFYTTDEHQMFNARQNKLCRVASDSVVASLQVKTNSLYLLRIDYECPSGEVVLSDLKVKGKNDRKVRFENLKTNQLSVIGHSDNQIHLKSSGSDPYVIFQDPLRVEPKKAFNARQCLSILIVFMLSFGLLYLCFTALASCQAVWEDVLFLCLFCVVVVIPGIRLSDDEKSLKENRMLAKKPQLMKTDELNNAFGSQFESWFNDHFFLRDRLVEAYYSAMYRLNRSGRVGDVIVGDEGWLFRAMDSYLYQNTLSYSEQQLQNIASYLSDFSDWCHRHGKEFRFIIAPDKERVYGDLQHIYRKTKPDSLNWTWQLISYIEQHTDVDVIYPLDELKEARTNDNRLLYYKYDTHWSELGAYYGYRKLMNTLPPDWQMSPLPMDNLTSLKKPYRDISAKLANALPPDSSDYFCPQFDFPVERSKEYVLNGRVDFSNPMGQKSAFFLHDSFSKNMLDCWFSNSFQHIAADWHYQATPAILNEIVKDGYDLVVLEVVERFSCLLADCSFPND